MIKVRGIKQVRFSAAILKTAEKNNKKVPDRKYHLSRTNN
jgi:hypothetical protein